MVTALVQLEIIARNLPLKPFLCMNLWRLSKDVMKKELEERRKERVKRKRRKLVMPIYKTLFTILS